LTLGNLTVALELAVRGIPVFPVAVRQDGSKLDKQPVVAWRTASTTDASTLAGWWNGPYSDCVVGIDLGKVGLLVVDADRHFGGADGVAAFRELAKGRSLADHPVTCTPSNGLHFFFKQPEPPLGNGRGRLPAGLDVRGAGGLVVAPGSVWQGREWGAHPNYPHLIDAYGAAIPVVPGWLHEILLPPPRPERRDWQIAGSSARLRSLVRTVVEAAEGERNCILFWAACRASEIVQARELSAGFVFDVLVDAAARAGLPQAEARRTVQSGLRRG
jgi:hypothetical protein